MNENKYIKIYIEKFINSFRIDNKDNFKIIIHGIQKFYDNNNLVLSGLINSLNDYGFEIVFCDEIDSIQQIQVLCLNITSDQKQELIYNIQDIPNTIELSSKTNIPIIGIIIMRIVAILINQLKIMYKAIVLDLDETLWPGILIEEGVEKIKEYLSSELGKPYIAFMNYVKILAEQLGIFVAICSRNNLEQVQNCIGLLDQNAFPLKDQVDCIIANNNDKSENIRAIAKQLSILPKAVVFIDDNQIVRDEVRKEIPEIFVPDWQAHTELITQLNISCIFERFELSIYSQQRKKQFRFIKAEREKNSLPELYIRVKPDKNSSEAKKMYAKSNQFKAVKVNFNYEKEKSLIFEIFRDNGDSLGVCSVITYTEVDDSICGILNWAISCRYFEIGLEEFVLLYLLKQTNNRSIHFVIQNHDENKKIQEFVDKYYGRIIFDDCSSVPVDSNLVLNYYQYDCKDKSFAELIRALHGAPFDIYDFETDNRVKSILKNNTKLKLLE